MRSATAWVVAMLAGCGPSGTMSDPEVPPMGASAMGSWLAEGHYLKWKCEAAAHDARPQSPHSRNRICSNAKLSGAGAGEYPVDSASVKELFSGTATAPTGYAVARHHQAGTTGDSWYWYEKLGASVVADGTNVSGCAGCHQAAGSDAQHTGHDFIYTQVR